MAIMMKSAHRAEGAEQPSIKLGMFRIRIPFVHAPWELPEMIQAMVVFVTGVSAVAYLQDIFGLPFSVALSIVCIHELLYVFQNLVGDPIVGGWITPAIPLVTTWLLSFQNTTERIQALVMLQLILGLLYLILGVEPAWEAEVFHVLRGIGCTAAGGDGNVAGPYCEVGGGLNAVTPGCDG